QAGGLGLLGRDAQGHLFVVESDDVDFQSVTRDFLGFDRRDGTDAMRRVDDLVADVEIMTDEGGGVSGHRRTFRSDGAGAGRQNLDLERQKVPASEAVLGWKVKRER